MKTKTEYVDRGISKRLGKYYARNDTKGYESRGPFDSVKEAELVVDLLTLKYRGKKSSPFYYPDELKQTEEKLMMERKEALSKEVEKVRKEMIEDGTLVETPSPPPTSEKETVEIPPIVHIKDGLVCQAEEEAEEVEEEPDGFAARVKAREIARIHARESAKTDEEDGKPATPVSNGRICDSPFARDGVQPPPPRLPSLQQTGSPAAEMYVFARFLELDRTAQARVLSYMKASHEMSAAK